MLRARKYDAAAALKLVEATAEWRRSNAIPTLAARTPYEVLGCMEGAVVCVCAAEGGGGISQLLVPSFRR